MTLEEVNTFSARDAIALFLKCCGSKRWANEINNRRPFKKIDDLCTMADEIWYSLTELDWKEAFAQHPKIGQPDIGLAGDVESLRKKFQSTQEWTSEERSGVSDASERTLKALAEGNNAYETKYGYIFIVCATGKSAEEMLTLLHQRLTNDPNVEIKIAAHEQAKITKIRLEKIIRN